MYSNDIKINRLKREEEMFPIPFVFDTTEWASSQMLGYFHRIAHYARQLPMHFCLNILCYVTLSEKYMETELSIFSGSTYFKIEHFLPSSIWTLAKQFTIIQCINL